MTQVLARVVADIAIFLEFSDESILDPDASIAQLELLASRVQALPERQRRGIAGALRSLAPSEPAHEDFLRNLPDTLGID